jgi:hypothetical protein
MNSGQPLLYAADDGPNRRIDVFDSSFHLVDNLGPDAFVDPKIPQKFAPYGIQTVTAANGTQVIWVTYTALDKAQGEFVDSFSPHDRETHRDRRHLGHSVRPRQGGWLEW